MIVFFDLQVSSHGILTNVSPCPEVGVADLRLTILVVIIMLLQFLTMALFTFVNHAVLANHRAQKEIIVI